MVTGGGVRARDGVRGAHLSVSEGPRSGGVGVDGSHVLLILVELLLHLLSHLGEGSAAILLPKKVPLLYYLILPAPF